MTQKPTLDLIVKSIKQQYEIPSILQIKQYAKILKQHGNYKQINLALNDISKSMGYRKFADYKSILIEKGIIVEFIFTVQSDTTFKMPFSISIHCEFFLDTNYEDLLNNLNNPYLVISRDSMYIQYSNNKIFTLFSYFFNIVEPEGALSYKREELTENIKKPKTIEELYDFLIFNRVNILFYYNQEGTISYDNKENACICINLANNTLLKPINKQKYKAHDLKDSLQKL